MSRNVGLSTTVFAAVETALRDTAAADTTADSQSDAAADALTAVLNTLTDPATDTTAGRPTARVPVVPPAFAPAINASPVVAYAGQTGSGTTRGLQLGLAELIRTDPAAITLLDPLVAADPDDPADTAYTAPAASPPAAAADADLAADLADVPDAVTVATDVVLSPFAVWVPMDDAPLESYHRQKATQVAAFIAALAEDRATPLTATERDVLTVALHEIYHPRTVDTAYLTAVDDDGTLAGGAPATGVAAGPGTGASTSTSTSTNPNSIGSAAPQLPGQVFASQATSSGPALPMTQFGSQRDPWGTIIQATAPDAGDTRGVWYSPTFTDVRDVVDMVERYPAHITMWRTGYDLDCTLSGLLDGARTLATKLTDLEHEWPSWLPAPDTAQKPLAVQATAGTPAPGVTATRGVDWGPDCAAPSADATATLPGGAVVARLPSDGTDAAVLPGVAGTMAAYERARAADAGVVALDHYPVGDLLETTVGHDIMGGLTSAARDAPREFRVTVSPSAMPQLHAVAGAISPTYLFRHREMPKSVVDTYRVTGVEESNIQLLAMPVEGKPPESFVGQPGEWHRRPFPYCDWNPLAKLVDVADES